MTNHRYIVHDGQAFFVYKPEVLADIFGAFDQDYCAGSWSTVLTQKGGVGSRVTCPVCGRSVCVSRKRNQTLKHYRPEALEVFKQMVTPRRGPGRMT